MTLYSFDFKCRLLSEIAFKKSDIISKSCCKDKIQQHKKKKKKNQCYLNLTAEKKSYSGFWSNT